MKTNSLINKYSVSGILGIAYCCLCLTPRTALPGFEIGNGRKLIKNTNGSYEIIIPEKLEVGFANRYTEIIAPLFEGTPRARLQINIVKADSLNTLADLVESRSGQGWEAVKLAGLNGIKKVEILPTRLQQIEYRLLYRPTELIVINAEGVPSGSPATAFEMLQQSLETFQVGEHK